MKINTQKAGRFFRVQYFQAIPEMIKYQIVTKAVLYLIILVLNVLAQWAIHSTGRVAIVSNDYRFLFTTWQGVVLLTMGLLLLMCYVALDLNAKVYLSENLLFEKEDSAWRAIRQSLASIIKFRKPNGIFVVLYMSLIAPLVGMGITISLTADLYVPSFIKSVIRETPLYLGIYNVTVVLLLLVGILNIFLMHGLLLDDLSVHEASRRSMKLLFNNWRQFLVRILLFSASYALYSFVILSVVFVLPMNMVGLLSKGGEISRVLMIFLCLVSIISSALVTFLWTPLLILKLTQMYFTFTEHENIVVPMREHEKHPVIIAGTAVTLLLCLAAAVGMNHYFDELFPEKVGTEIIAHRGGGAEGRENTLSGLQAAIDLGVYGSEIDVQRTRDGYYVCYHDNDFSRLAGDKRRLRDMTFRQVRKIALYPDAEDGGDRVPLLGEMLDCAKDKIVLFVELKGQTADYEMAEDVVRIIKNMGMQDQTVILSLKYNLIDYIEERYPEMNTGFLSWATFGNKGALNCDYVALEEESATFRTILLIHYYGKKVLVWTPNSESELKYSLCSRADALITDQISLALLLTRELEARNDIDRMLDTLLESMF